MKLHVFLMRRYNVDDENSLAVVNEEDAVFRLQEEISKSYEELTKIYGSLVRVFFLSKPSSFVEVKRKIYSCYVLID